MPGWPGGQPAGGLLAEALPAAQLTQWGRTQSKYAGSSAIAVRNRRTIVTALQARIGVDSDLRVVAENSADALDALLCLFAGISAVKGLVNYDLGADSREEGVISIHP